MVSRCCACCSRLCNQSAGAALRTLESHPFRLPQFAGDDSGAEVLLGRTRVLTAVSAELVPPFADRGNEGRVQYNVEFSPMASPAFEAGRPGALCAVAISCPHKLQQHAPLRWTFTHMM